MSWVLSMDLAEGAARMESAGKCFDSFGERGIATFKDCDGGGTGPLMDDGTASPWTFIALLLK